MNVDPVPGSFRDPSGFLSRSDGVIYRQVNVPYRQNYDRLMASGLYEELVADGRLISHEEVGIERARSADAYKVLKPRPLQFVSYPYEWCFSHLKDAALATLEIQKKSLQKGMSLKDASAYNIQVFRGNHLLIDTLSFEEYQEGRPWVAYRQFCQHFLTPLALMSQTETRLSQLLRVYTDGIPLDLASSLLPWSSRFRFTLAVHIHAHARAQQRYAAQKVEYGATDRHFSRKSFFALLDSLETAIQGLTWKPRASEWLDYYESKQNYGVDGLDQKARIISEFLAESEPGTVWDLAANTGRFSRIASRNGSLTISFDVDPACVEENYLTVRRERDTHVLPLLLDLMNPSPALGWDHSERLSLEQRGPADVVLVLGLIHHLAIRNNVPLPRIASFLRKLCRRLVIEFVPKSDSQVQRLLAAREDVFPLYTREEFEKQFGAHFEIQRSAAIPGTDRILYLMRST